MSVWAILTWIFILSCFSVMSWKDELEAIFFILTSIGCVCVCVRAHASWMMAGGFHYFGRLSAIHPSNMSLVLLTLTSLALQLCLCLTFLLNLLFFFCSFTCFPSLCLSKHRYIILTYLTALQLVQLCQICC